jgi:hypothetical protein
VLLRYLLRKNGASLWDETRVMVESQQWSHIICHLNICRLTSTVVATLELASLLSQLGIVNLRGRDDRSP